MPAGRWLSFGGLAVLALAMAGPTVDVPTPRSAGTVIMAIDVSQSMTATDVSPSRLEAAKKVATTLIEAQPGQRGHRCRGLGAGALSAGEPECGPRAGCSRCGAPHPSGGTPLAGAILRSLSAITERR